MVVRSDVAREGQIGLEGMLMPELLVDFITSLDGYGSAEGLAGLVGTRGT